MLWGVLLIVCMTAFVAVGVFLIVGTLQGVPFLVRPERSIYNRRNPVLALFGSQPERVLIRYNLFVGLLFVVFGAAVLVWTVFPIQGP